MILKKAIHMKLMCQWPQNLLDGRFAKDKLLCFSTLNYIFRQRNQTQNQWFVNDFVGECPPTLEELKDKLSLGTHH